MFERYTEKARRVIFFARYEGSQFGSPSIETEHLLLGLLREDKALTNRFLRAHASVESIRKQIEGHTTIREKVSTSVDLPLSNECKRVLAYAAEEAERLGHKHIGTEHLLLGLLREEKCFAAELLKERGVKLAATREELVTTPHVAAAPVRAGEVARTSSIFSDLTQAAMDGQLGPVVNRELELDCLIEVLSSRDKRNPMLIGERGVGKSAIVEGLAQRIADGSAPSHLAGKKIVVIGPELLENWTREKQCFDELEKLFGSMTDSSEVILFIDGLHGVAPTQARTGALASAAALNFALVHREVQCICAGTSGEYAEASAAMPWLAGHFRAIHVRPFNAVETLAVLQVRKSRLEKFHGVTYAEDALQFAANAAGGFLSAGALPAKALELLDAAGAAVKLRQSEVPVAVKEVQKRLRFIAHRLAVTIANHEFEKARFYSDEERKERENLRALKERLQPEGDSSTDVGEKDVAAAMARLAGYPYCP